MNAIAVIEGPTVRMKKLFISAKDLDSKYAYMVASFVSVHRDGKTQKNQQVAWLQDF